MLNAELFSGREVAENAKILLRFVRHTDRLNQQANSVGLVVGSARDPRAPYHMQSHTMFEGFGYDLNLPTAPEALNKIYKKHAMKPMRHSLQLKKDAPFGSAQRMGKGSA